MRACFVFTVEGAHRPQIKIINAVQYMVQLGINTVLTEIYTVTCFYISQLMAKVQSTTFTIVMPPKIELPSCIISNFSSICFETAERTTVESQRSKICI